MTWRIVFFCEKKKSKTLGKICGTDALKIVFLDVSRASGLRVVTVGYSNRIKKVTTYLDDSEHLGLVTGIYPLKTICQKLKTLLALIHSKKITGS